MFLYFGLFRERSADGHKSSSHPATDVDLSEERGGPDERADPAVHRTAAGRLKRIGDSSPPG